MTLSMWLPAAFACAGILCAAGAWRQWRRDPRRPAALGWINTAIVCFAYATAFGTCAPLSQVAANVALGAPVVAAPLAVFLLNAGLLVVLPEGRKRPNVVAGIAGVLMAVVLGACTLTPLAFLPALPVAIGVSLTLAWLSIQFWTFLAYSEFYRQSVRVDSATYVVVLGAGLVGDQVSPLLAQRVERGLDAHSRIAARGAAPALVMSGGQGPDEALPESHAMQRHAQRFDTCPSTVLIEDRSTTTEENLLFTRKLLERLGVLKKRNSRGACGPEAGTGAHVPTGCEDQGIAVTSDFHALRAATLAARLGLRMDAVGAPSARHVWPAAVAREGAALVRDTRAWQLAMWVGAVLPLPLALAVTMWG